VLLATAGRHSAEVSASTGAAAAVVLAPVAGVPGSFPVWLGRQKDFVTFPSFKHNYHLFCSARSHEPVSVTFLQNFAKFAKNIG
jgi:hypothetical protein